MNFLTTNTMNVFNTLDPLNDPFMSTLPTLDPLNDPFMSTLPTLDPTTTFFDPFSPIPPWPWSLGPKLQLPKQDDQGPQSLQLTQTQLESFKRELASPVSSPATFWFEIEADTTKYEPCYDEFMETKLSVLTELSKKTTTIPAIEDALLDVSLETLQPVYSIEALLENGYTLPDTFIDDLYEEMNRPLDIASPCPSLSSSVTSSPSTTSTISVGTPQSVSYLQSEPWLDLWDSASVDENANDGDYQPFEYPQTPRKKANEKRSDNRQPVRRETGVSTKSFPETPIKSKRKAPPLERDGKRQKMDPNVICRIKGCRHISKTRFECEKHRETHFPGRFRCPYPACQKVFVRSSSLSRHLKRPRNTKCSAYAGVQEEWGVGLEKFSLRPPEWKKPGFLDAISDESLHIFLQ